MDSLRESIEGSEQLPDDFKRKLLQSIEESEGKLQKVREDVEKWFNEAMDRITGTYKKLSQKIILPIAIAITVAFNADSISILKYLYDHPAQTASLADHISTVVAETENSKSDTTSLALEKKIEKNVKELQRIERSLQETKLPLGWENQPPLVGVQWLTKIWGLLLTAIAAVLGAPFWFDMLNKLVNLRSAGKKPMEVDETLKAKK